MATASSREKIVECLARAGAYTCDDVSELTRRLKAPVISHRCLIWLRVGRRATRPTSSCLRKVVGQTVIVVPHYSAATGSCGNHRRPDVVEPSSRCSINIARAVHQWYRAQLLVTMHSDDRGRRFEAGPKRCLPGSHALQPAVLPVSSSPSRCACGLRESRPYIHAQAGRDAGSRGRLAPWRFAARTPSSVAAGISPTNKATRVDWTLEIPSRKQ